MDNRKFLSGEAFKTLAEAQQGLREPGTTIQLEEGQRQLTLLALAKLSVERPGFRDSLEEIALKMDNRNEDGRPAMFIRLREYA